MQSHYPIMNLPQPRGTNCELNDHDPEVMTLVNEAYITINTKRWTHQHILLRARPQLISTLSH